MSTQAENIVHNDNEPQHHQFPEGGIYTIVPNRTSAVIVSAFGSRWVESLGGYKARRSPGTTKSASGDWDYAVNEAACGT